MISVPSIAPPVSSAPSWLQMSSIAKYSSPLRATATMRRPTGMEIAWPSRNSAVGPASIQFTNIASHQRPRVPALHHAGLQPRLFRHHGLVPRQIEHQFDIGPGYRRNDLDLVAHILHQDLAHAAAGRGQGHFDVDRARRIFVLADIALVNQPKVDDVYRDLWVIASLELAPDDGLDVFFRCARRHFGSDGGALSDGVRLLAGNAEQVAVDIHREAASQRLGDVADRTEFEVDFDSGGDGDCLDVALHDDGLIFVRLHSSSNSFRGNRRHMLRIWGFQGGGERVPA